MSVIYSLVLHMASSLVNATIFLINTLFDLYIMCVLLRFLLQIVRADFYNPICQFLIKITNPLLLPLRRVFKGIWRIDLAAIVLMLLLEVLKLSILMYGLQSVYPYWYGLLVLSVAYVFQQTTSLYFFVIIILAILSWVSPQSLTSPVGNLLRLLTEPLLRPVRRFIPVIGGFDLSPVVVLIGIQLINILFIQNLLTYGMWLTIRG